MLSYGFLWDCMLVVPRHKAKQNTHIKFFWFFCLVLSLPKHELLLINLKTWFVSTLLKIIYFPSNSN